MQNLVETVRTAPVQTQLSVRPQEIRGITSAYAGRIHPVTCFNLLREDRVQTMDLNVLVEMMETPEMLLNGIKVTARAVFVPHLAMDRFEGSLDRMNRSYEGIADKDGGDVIPYFTTHAYSAAAPFYRALGIHAPSGALINTSYLSSYNQYVNFLYRSMSKNLTERTELDTSLAACPWSNNQFSHIVPDFDQAALDGELDLNIANAQLPVRGYYRGGTSTTQRYYNDDGTDVGGTSSSESGYPLFTRNPGGPTTDGLGDIYAELADQGITLSLSNIELAKKTAAFAKIRSQMKGLDDEHIIDLLMEGIRVPDAQLAQPILLAKRSTLIGYNRRFATDSANLEESVTTGETSIGLKVRTPSMNTGGVIIVTVEIVPEQLYERMQDPFLFTSDPSTLPSFTRDYLDPEMVDVVPNKYVDISHANPDLVFGYAPLNHAWRKKTPNVGGKYMRQAGDPFDENRQRIWAVEQTDPSLTSDFYLAENIHHNVFRDQLSEPFEITTVGMGQIVGNTVFGKGLQEDTGDYAAISADVDTGRVDQTNDPVE